MPFLLDASGIMNSACEGLACDVKGKDPFHFNTNPPFNIYTVDFT